MYKFYYYFIIISLFLIPAIVGAQTPNDSLLKMNYDELINDFYKNRKTDSIKAKKIAEFILNKAKKEKDTFRIAKAYELTYRITSYETGTRYLDSIIKITKRKQNKDFPLLAYFRKAQFYLSVQRNIDKTLDNLNIARKIAKKNNDTAFLYRIDHNIAIVRSEHLGEKEKAIQIFKKCANFYQDKTDSKYMIRYLFTLHAIAETYIGLKKNDSASHYNNLGYAIASQHTGNTINKIKSYFTLCEGINQNGRDKYTATIDSIHKALPTMIEYEDVSNTLDSYFYLGKSYYELKNKEKAIFYFKKTDSVLETLNSTPQYKHIKTYEYLKDYYKSINDLNGQNKYLNKLNSVLDNYLNDQIFISKKVKEDYDIPLLLEEQQILIKKLSKNNNTYMIGILVLAILLLVSGSLIYYQYKKRQLYRIRFEQLTSDIKSNDHIKITNQNKPITKDNELKVPEKHVTYILAKLEEFEQNRDYLRMGLSSQSLADTIETNVKYLSLVINHYKNKSFSSYLNELRITYAVKELQENSTLQKFTIKAIANEFGYNSSETFSNAFYKQVKIKPSYFIKELRKKKN
ncbi:AraC family transcriptional regulator [Aquimarina sp. AU474]|uniref:helix-turn-helix domain-containing protein n=1 Tax=Aquimarina sp. AU474 TaxID=2108529 RepID=UPI000D688C59|nr:helix-turn-helix domain-containing protein [Aquimarina sp. AU474]